MQDVDSPTHVQRLAPPRRHRGARVEIQPLGLVSRSERVHWIIRHSGRHRSIRQRPPIGTPEPQLAIGASIELEALFMDGAVMTTAQESEIGQRGGATLGPVTDVMALAEANAAAGEAAAVVSVVERAPQGGRNRATTGRHLHDTAVSGVLHDHPARVAGQAARRFRGNVRPVLEHGLAGLIGAGEGRGVDVDHHLVALARVAGVHAVVEGRFREECQSVRLKASPTGCATLKEHRTDAGNSRLCLR